MNIYSFSIASDTLKGLLNNGVLASAIQSSSITASLDSINSNGDVINIVFTSTLTPTEETTLSSLVSAHDGTKTPEEVQPTEVKIVEEIAPAPFAAKTLSNGKKLFKRVHGIKTTLSENNVITLSVPYNECKINAIEILWAPVGLQADFKIYDTPTGTISSTLESTNNTPIPNLLLNQFGFACGIAKDYYKEVSNYDADLIKDMKLEITIINPNNLTNEICVNFILHELK